MKQISYALARQSMKVGDVIAFSGKSPVSLAIQAATNSPVSHVGVITQTDTYDGDIVNMIIESRGKHKGVSGVGVSRMSERLAEYDGSVWWLPTDSTFDSYMFTVFMLSQVGKKYDAPQAIGSAVDFLPEQQENLDRLFCSELVAAGLENAGIITDVNASETTPADVVAFPIYGEIRQLKGDLRDI